MCRADQKQQSQWALGMHIVWPQPELLQLVWTSLWWRATQSRPPNWAHSAQQS
jgi:hypothetical protein